MGLSSHNGDKDFVWCLNLPRVYISSPLDALRTFSFSPALAQRRGGLYLASTLPQELHLLAPRNTEDFFSFSPALARRRGGL